MQKRDRIFLCLLPFLLLCGCARGAQTPALNVPEVEVTAAQTEFTEEIVYLGDSTTAHMATRADVQKTQILATRERYLNLDPNITKAKVILPTTGEALPIAEAVAALAPRYLVITLGIDYAVYYYRDDPDALRACYEKLLDAIKEAAPGTRVVLQSVFPVAERAPVSNEMIRRANETIRALAAARGLYYLDTYPVLADADGVLRDEYCDSADGIHLTAAAYAAILSHIKACESGIRGVEQ